MGHAHVALLAMTDAEAREALQAREPIFHRPELGTSRVNFERMTDESFWEVGASGRVYDREFVLDWRIGGPKQSQRRRDHRHRTGCRRLDWRRSPRRDRTVGMLQ